MTTPKDIEAAEKLVKTLLDEYEVSGFGGGETCLQSENYEASVSRTGISRIAQALAAAREEGRLDMRDECAEVVRKASGNFEDVAAKCLLDSPQELRAIACAAAATEIERSIRNLPTNAPEGESE